MNKIFIVCLVLGLSLSCSTHKKEEKEIQNQVSQTEVSVNNLGKTIQDLIENSKTLTKDQKTELGKILEINKKRAHELIEESYKFRVVLVKELLSPKMNQKKINMIKSDIKKIEAKRLKNTFLTIEKFTKIISEHPNHHDFSDHLINIERPYR